MDGSVAESWADPELQPGDSRQNCLAHAPKAPKLAVFGISKEPVVKEKFFE
jgi:hypothetical protein